MPPVHERSATAAINIEDLIALDEGVASEPHRATDEAAAPSALDLLFRGLEIARSGRLDVAAETIAQSVLKDPTSADAYEALASVLLALGNLEFACKAKAKAVGLGYNAPGDWETLGDMFFALGQPVDAAEAFNTALTLSPGSVALREKLRAARPNGEARHSDPHSIPAAWRTVNLITVEPDGYAHAAAFHDLTASFESALQSLGIRVNKRKNSVGLEGINMLFGAHLINAKALADKIPHNTVIVNLEQFRGFKVGDQHIYLSLLRRLAVWDYSARNVEQVKRLTHNNCVSRFGIGYAPVMNRFLPAGPQTTDVLFYGSLNDRRRAVLEALTRAGLKVRHLFSIYGDARDQEIADAKVVLNMHFYEDSIHEIVRTSFLLANAKAVVSECGPETEIDDDVREALVAVPYHDLVKNCVALVKDDAHRRAIEQRGFELFSKRDQAAMLRDAIMQTVLPALG
jgi:hypothetical protein